jgi:hypothetical protein
MASKNTVKIIATFEDLDFGFLSEAKAINGVIQCNGCPRIISEQPVKCFSNVKIKNASLKNRATAEMLGHEFYCALRGIRIAMKNIRETSAMDLCDLYINKMGNLLAVAKNAASSPYEKRKLKNIQRSCESLVGPFPPSISSQVSR